MPVHNHECWWCRAAGGFVGIKNGGATCYMNSLFQQLFMQPSIRAFLLAGPEMPAADRDDSVFYQLQVAATALVACIDKPHALCVQRWLCMS